MIKKGTLSIVILALVTVVAAFLIFFQQSKKYPTSLEKLSIGATTQELSTLIWIADDQGYFAQNGLDVTLKGYDTGIETIDALFAGEVDVADTVDFVVSGLALEEKNFKILASIDTADINHIIARKDHGISQPSDLKDKKIALKQGSSSEFYIGKFLTLNGLRLRDVELVYSHPPDMPDMIAQGEIDATITWHPHNYNIENRLGENAIRWSAQTGQDVYWVILGLDDFVQSSPGKIERLLQALVQAEEFVRNNEAEAKQIMARRVGLDVTYMESVWSDFDFEVTLPQALIITLEDETRWRIDKYLTDKIKPPNFLNYFLFRWLR